MHVHVHQMDLVRDGQCCWKRKTRASSRTELEDSTAIAHKAYTEDSTAAVKVVKELVVRAA